MIAISPLSASLLSTREIQMSRPVTLRRLTPRAALPVVPQVDRETYLRTTGALLQNYSTSPWVTDRFFISPFWPENHMGSIWQFRANSSVSWEADTTVYRTSFKCAAVHASNWSCARTSYEGYSDASALLVSEDGCQMNLSLQMARPTMVTSVPQWDFAVWIDILTGFQADMQGRVNYSLVKDCSAEELILASTPWFSENDWNCSGILEDRFLRAYACHSEYASAVLPVHATSNRASLEVTFDEKLFDEIATPVSSTIFDMPSFRVLDDHNEWKKFIPRKRFLTSMNYPDLLLGTASLFGSMYNQNIRTMVDDAGLSEAAALAKRIFFAETLRTTFSNTSKVEVEPVSGVQQSSDRRILVSTQVASLLCALLVVCWCGQLVLLAILSQRQRPLNLRQDPSSVLGVSRLIFNDVLLAFRYLDISSREGLKEKLAGHRFITTSNGLQEIATSTAPFSPSE
jgi:hypothetical protein